jgi:hypothetical protein
LLNALSYSDLDNEANQRVRTPWADGSSWLSRHDAPGRRIGTKVYPWATSAYSTTPNLVRKDLCDGWNLMAELLRDDGCGNHSGNKSPAACSCKRDGVALAKSCVTANAGAGYGERRQRNPSRFLQRIPAPETSKSNRGSIARASHLALWKLDTQLLRTCAVRRVASVVEVTGREQLTGAGQDGDGKRRHGEAPLLSYLSTHQSGSSTRERSPGEANLRSRRAVGARRSRRFNGRPPNAPDWFEGPPNGGGV